MRQIIIQLIQEEIKMTRLVQHLERGGFDTQLYIPQFSHCIFQLAELESMFSNYIILKETYGGMIEEIAAKPLMDLDHLWLKSEEVLQNLENWKNQRLLPAS